MEIDHAQAQVKVTSVGSANIHSFLLRTFKGRPVILRPGSRHLPALNMLSAVAATVGREVHVFFSPAALPPSDQSPSTDPRTDDEPDEFYEFTAEDYARTMASYRRQDLSLRTRKMREEEEEARRSRISKATIRVQFPDNYVLEAVFQASDPVSLLFDLLQKVITLPEETFYLYTAPPKQRLKDLHQSMYDSRLTPGALVYFSYDSGKGQGEMEGPYLRPEIAALRDLHLLESPVKPQEVVLQDAGSGSLPSTAEPVPVQNQQSKRSSGKPKWFKQR